VDTFIGVLISP